MSKKDKLIKRLLSRPSDFTFEELIALFGSFGYSLYYSGKTGGSRVKFSNNSGDYIKLHKPHPRNELKPYQINEIIVALAERNLI